LDRLEKRGPMIQKTCYSILRKPPLLDKRNCMEQIYSLHRNPLSLMTLTKYCLSTSQIEETRRVFISLWDYRRTIVEQPCLYKLTPSRNHKKRKRSISCYYTVKSRRRSEYTKVRLDSTSEVVCYLL
jgi:hypothetical protein